MKVLVYETSQTGGTTFALKDAFEALGHSAAIFDYQKYLYGHARPSLYNRLRDRFLFAGVAARINADLREMLSSERYDLLLVVRGDHVYPETIKMAQERGAKTATWSSDDIFNPVNSTKHILRAFRQYDRVFSPRAHLREEYVAKGARSFEAIDWYYRPGLLLDRPSPGTRAYEFDIGFIGSWSPRREKLLGELNGLNLHIWGWGWARKARKDFFARKNFHGQVSMTDMMQIFARTKINVNILTHENRDTTNFRNFEIPAAGAFQLSERSNEVCGLFVEGQEIACFGSGEELRATCERYLENDALREAIAVAGYDRLIGGHHSILDRARQISAWAERHGHDG
jgi:spore maturation protein CgeB